MGVVQCVRAAVSCQNTPGFSQLAKFEGAGLPFTTGLKPRSLSARASAQLTKGYPPAASCICRAFSLTLVHQTIGTRWQCRQLKHLQLATPTPAATTPQPPLFHRPALLNPAAAHSCATSPPPSSTTPPNLRPLAMQPPRIGPANRCLEACSVEKRPQMLRCPCWLPVHKRGRRCYAASAGPPSRQQGGAQMLRRPC